MDTEETENFDGSKTITDHYEWYVRDNVPVRSEYFEKFRRISDGFLDELRQEWVDSYRGPLKAMAFVDTSTPENNYWLYWDRVVSNFERYNRDHAAFLRQERCASPTVQKYERAIDRLTLWE